MARQLSLLELMQASSLLQNPRIEATESQTDATARTGPASPHTGIRAPDSVEESEGETPAVIAAREADQNLRG